MPDVKPIDRAKKSNRRCVNCANYGKRILTKRNGEKITADEAHDNEYSVGTCPTAGGKTINYWNCCKCFRWNPEKTYTEPLPEEDAHV